MFNAHILTLPFFLTPLGIAGIPLSIYWGITKSDGGGSGSLGFVLPAIFVAVAAGCGAVLTIPAVLLGIPWFFAFPVTYYLSMVGMLYGMLRE